MLEATREETSSKTGEGGPDNKEAEALAAALNRSAERVQTLWFSFLAFMSYLAIAAWTTTHSMIFLESPLPLPALYTSLPLVSFYIVTPVIFIVFHFYMLLNLVLLARTAKSFDDALARASPDDHEMRESFRMRIENALFTQLLVGGRLEREGHNARFLRLMALITLVAAPVALLLLLEIRFLPYHSWRITWWHRGLLAVDLLLVWTLWPAYRIGWGVVRVWPKWGWRLALPGVLSGVALIYAVLVAAFPNERMYMLANGLHESWPYKKVAPPNTLDVHGENLVDDKKMHIIESIQSLPGAGRWIASLDLKQRDLTGAHLEEADIRHVDFSDAVLNGASFDRASAKDAHFTRAQLQNAHLAGTQLEGAELNNAQLNEASLDKAELQGASLEGAQLQGASLDAAQLQGAWLEGAQLQGASLNGAQLQGAWLEGAQLQGASLSNAQLQGAILSSAQFQGASLEKANLKVAWFLDADLEGAKLSQAKLQGAWFDRAQLQGTSLEAADLEEAWFQQVFVWRAETRNAFWKNTIVEGPVTEPKYSCPKNDGGTSCEWTVEKFEELKSLITKRVPEAKKRDEALDRIKHSLDPNLPLEGERKIAKQWADQSHPHRAHGSSHTDATKKWFKTTAEQWHTTGCAFDGAPYVVRACLRLVQKYPELLSVAEVPQVAHFFLEPQHCPGARGLTAEDNAKLQEISDRAPPAAPRK